MAKTELKLKTKNAATEQAITTTVGYVNPEADSNTLKTFGQMLNALTTNTYIETDRVQTINVDTEQVITTKPGTLQLKSNPVIATSSTEVQIALNQFIINGEAISSVSTSHLLIGIFQKYQQSKVYPAHFTNVSGEGNPDYLSIDRDNGTYQLQSGDTGTLILAVQPMNGYTAATMSQEITIP